MISPKIAIISSFFYSILIAVREKFFIPDIFPIIVLIFFHRSSILKIFKRLIKLNGFIIFVCAGIIFFHKDYHFALIIFIRSNLIILFNLLIFNNFIPFDVYRGIIPLPIPKKIKILFLFFIKFIEIFQREYNKLIEALKVRGFKPRTNLFTYKSYAYIIAILFAKILKKSKNLYDAITLRGFKGEIFSFTNEKLTMIDFSIIAVIFIQFLNIFIRELK